MNFLQPPLPFAILIRHQRLFAYMLKSQVLDHLHPKHQTVPSFRQMRLQQLVKHLHLLSCPLMNFFTQYRSIRLLIDFVVVEYRPYLTLFYSMFNFIIVKGLVSYLIFPDFFKKALTINIF